MLKRIIDIIASFSALVLLSPIIIFLCYKVGKNLGKPVFFSQKRPGKNSVVFNMIKFRSMKDAVDENGKVLPDEDRLTPFGKKLRDSSLDELPGLWCVLKGDMSLVGPRPLLVDYLPLYSKAQARRHNVKPGITGWAQVNGRNALSWEQKFEYDCWYVDNQSLWLDIKIIFMTIQKVFKKEDISADGHVTMPAFTGSKKQEK